MPITAKQIREIELPTSRRGFDKQATRDLLESAAKALAEAIAERDELRRKLDERPAVQPALVPEAPAPAVAPVATQSATSNDLASIGAALLTAQRAGERLVQEAREEAVQIKAEADFARHALLKEAQADVANQMEGVKQRIEALTEQEANLRTMLGDRRTELAEFVHRAVDRLASSRPHTTAETLETVLRERVQEAHEPAGDTPVSENPDPAA